MHIQHAFAITKSSLEMGDQGTPVARINRNPSRSNHRNPTFITEVTPVCNSWKTRSHLAINLLAVYILSSKLFSRSLYYSLVFSLNLSFLPAFLSRISFLTKPRTSSPPSTSLLAAIRSSFPILYRDSALLNVVSPSCVSIDSSPTASGKRIPTKFDEEPALEKLEPPEEKVGDGVLPWCE